MVKMNKPFNNTGMMLRSLFKRDWLKYLFWLLGLLAYAASGVGKLELAITPENRASMFTLFNGPALVSLFGPTAVKNPQNFTGAAAFGGLMPLITVLVFAIVTIVYVVNRTRKDEDEGIAELLRSFQIGKLSNTTAVVIEVFLLQVILTFALAGSIQAQGAAGMGNLGPNLLFAASITGQSFMWGMLALLLAQIFPEAGSAKGATIGLFGILYVLRMGTDTTNVHLSWFNPLSWSYLTEPYVNNNVLPVVLTLILAVIALGAAYVLEIKRDVASGYLPEARGKAQAGKMLQHFTGLTLRMQRIAAIAWIVGLFALGITYGSMITKIGSLMGGGSGNTLYTQMLQLTTGANQTLMTQEFLSTIFMVIALMSTAFAITSLNRMVSEERKNRQEQLYALPISRLRVYANFTIIAWILAFLAQFAGTLGVYLAQMGNNHAVSAGTIFKAGLSWTIGIFFVLSLLSVLMAFIPRAASVIWIYLGFAFFMGMIGSILDFPKWALNLNIFHNIMKTTSATVLPNTPNGTNLVIILIVALVLTGIGFIGYRKRDLISG